jgi:hypothetical protein
MADSSSLDLRVSHKREMNSRRLFNVMAGLVPAIHVFARGTKDVDGRPEPGHDDIESARSAQLIETFD